MCTKHHRNINVSELPLYSSRRVDIIELGCQPSCLQQSNCSSFGVFRDVFAAHITLIQPLPNYYQVKYFVVKDKCI